MAAGWGRQPEKPFQQPSGSKTGSLNVSGCLFGFVFWVDSENEKYF